MALDMQPGSITKHCKWKAKGALCLVGYFVVMTSFPVARTLYVLKAIPVRFGMKRIPAL